MAPETTDPRREPEEAAGDAGEPLPEDPAPSRGIDTAADEELERRSRERDEWRDRALRAAADLDNYRKRMQREMLAAREEGVADLAGRLLEAVDNLERALQSLTAREREGNLATGVALVQQQLLEALGAVGIEPVRCEGEPFDPHRHEALLVVDRDDVAPGIVVEELRRGYRHGDRLLRASQVLVSRAPQEAVREGPDDGSSRRESAEETEDADET